MNEPHPPIGLVLDASAILSYVRGRIHVGEVLIEVADNGTVAALPVGSLVAAWQVAIDRDRLSVLVDHSATEVVGDAAQDWRTLAVLTELTGVVEAASAVLLANDYGCPVLSASPGLYGQVGGAGLVVAIPG